MQIILGTSINHLIFGCTKTQAREIIGGKENKAFFTDSGCHRLQFYEAKLELSFEPENNNRLGWIEIYHPDAIFFDKHLIGQPKYKMLETITKELGEPSEVWEYLGREYILYDDQWLELQLQFGRLQCINFGVLYDENEEPLWP
ncbi:hypothetical protein Lepto7376_2351 [[Leptolyngbya] sp. PCC 7376]|uniref:hypothetical protein n=1 Tax=[Leptolyngbya] sp. PCC 7376 TaxID=111781 RepID=UPI00029ED95F|nr:hypothetical protein [[Leptolyngbya] sp. PCC 7376]AFY38635.1 hypothetical protein Lepto7376_2351 [[Leptolyngbya] sp. PCC 7376]